MGREHLIIDDAAERLARVAVERAFPDHADRRRLYEEMRRHLGHLSCAISTDEDVLWLHYVRWAKSRVDDAEELRHQLESLERVVAEELDASVASRVSRLIHGSCARLDSMRGFSQPYTRTEEPLGDVALEFLHRLLNGKRRGALDFAHETFRNGTTIRDLYLHVFQPCQYEVGRRWQLGELTVAQEHGCTQTVRAIMGSFLSEMSPQDATGRCVLAASVEGEEHDIGIQMVADFFEIEGWDVMYLGAHTPTESLVRLVARHDVDMVAMSITNPEHLEKLRGAVSALKDQDEGVVVLCGGLPFQLAPRLAVQFGADGTASDADAAVALATRLFETVAD